MKKKTYTIAIMPSSGRRMKTYSISVTKLILVLIIVISLPAFASLAIWRYCEEQKQLAAEAVQDFEALNEELQEIKRSYSIFRSLLVEPGDELGRGGPRMPELADISNVEPSSDGENADDAMGTSTVFMEAAALKAGFQALGKIRDEKLDELARTPSIWPVKFDRSQLWISSGFGRRRNPFTGAWEQHSGIDIPAPIGTPLMATADGTVTRTGKDRFLGNFIEIRHSDRYSTLYGHMRRNKPFAEGIEKGTKVKRRQIIGYIGRTGRSTAPHVHYEVRHDGERVNPINYILD